MTPLTLSYILRLSFFPETMEIITTGLWCSLLKGHRSALLAYKGFSMASCILAAQKFLDTVASLYQAGILHRGQSMFSYFEFLSGIYYMVRKSI